jgi:CBS domain containing-hemolysin-like protein
MTVLLLVVGAGLAVSFLCSVLEAVLLSLTHSYVGVLEERGDGAGVLLARMRERIDEPIAAILTLNTIAHTVGAAIGGALALNIFGSQWIALFSAVLTFLILVLSEIVPKTLGATYWQVLAAPTAYTLRFMMIAMKPILVPLAWLNRLITSPGRRQPTVSRAELEILAEIGRKEGTIDQEEWQVLTNVMNLSEVRALDVMTPRTQIVAVRAEDSIEQAMQVMLDEGHLRLPVYAETLDDIIGILLAREAWRAARDDATASVATVMRAPHFVPETKPVEDLIREMRAARINMAIVIDEFGGTSGLVTLEDLIEEIVGEIQDEHETELPDFVGRDGRTLIAGLVPVWQVNERLGLELSEEEHDTIGGYVFGGLGRMPKEGDELPVPGGRFQVVTMSGRRVERVAFVPADGRDRNA